VTSNEDFDPTCSKITLPSIKPFEAGGGKSLLKCGFVAAGYVAPWLLVTWLCYLFGPHSEDSVQSFPMVWVYIGVVRALEIIKSFNLSLISTFIRRT
jgi:hypothetical protein